MCPPSGNLAIWAASISAQFHYLTTRPSWSQHRKRLQSGHILAFLCFALEVIHITSAHSLLARTSHMASFNCMEMGKCGVPDGMFGEHHYLCQSPPAPVLLYPQAACDAPRGLGQNCLGNSRRTYHGIIKLKIKNQSIIG